MTCGRTLGWGGFVVMRKTLPFAVNGGSVWPIPSYEVSAPKPPVCLGWVAFPEPHRAAEQLLVGKNLLGQVVDHDRAVEVGNTWLGTVFFAYEGTPAGSVEGFGLLSGVP
jgi:hypothetical protein